MEDALYRGNREPSLDELLAEPIIRTIMRRDGVDEQSIRQLMRRAADTGKPAKLNFISPKPPAARGDAPLQASAGVLTQATAAPHWPRVFPGL